jgi:octaprenyl-diphosphate synthase
MSTLTELYEPIDVHLKRVRAVLDEAVGSDLPVVDDLSRHVGRLRGKMLRPALLLLAGQACGRVRDEHYTLAAVVEMVHMASLVHDDVLDDAEVRRNAVTVNRMTTNETAVMLGDFLFSRAFLLCSGVSCQRTRQIVGAAAATVCEGELVQLSHCGDWRLSEEQYLAIVERKTAALTAASCELGALQAGADARTVRGLRDYGRSVGVAFQIVDDIVDITGRQEREGKTLGSDARKGKLTLPMIHHLRAGSNGSAERMLAYLAAPEAPDRGQIQEWLSETGSVEYALRLARGHAVRAVESLEPLPASPARAQLEGTARFIVAGPGHSLFV